MAAVNKVILGTDVLMDISDSTVTSDTMAAGTVAYRSNGEKITGTFTLDNELSEQDSLLQHLKTTIESLPDATTGSARAVVTYSDSVLSIS